MISGHQIRMARTAVRFGVRELAARAQVSPATVTRIENGSAANAATLSAIMTVLEKAGAVFMEKSNGDQGVMLTRTGACTCDLVEIARMRPKDNAQRLARTRIDEFFGQLHAFERSANRDGRVWADKLRHLVYDRMRNSDPIELAVLDDCVKYIGRKTRRM